MELKSLSDKLSKIWKKYKYVVIVVAAGVLLMLIPDNKTESNLVHTDQVPKVTTEDSFEQRLAKILCNVEGAGDVEVILTAAVGEEVVYQTDDDRTIGENTTTTRINTVTITDAQRNQGGLIRQVVPPIYKGAVIICQGGDNPTVRLQIVDAVSKLTGLGANHISVLKMK